MTKMLVVLCAVFGFVATAHAQPNDTPIVQTVDGKVQGTATGDVQSFKGIPFAAPPVDALRWRPPADPAVWTGVRNAAQFGAKCPQPSFPPPIGNAQPMSEDCLTLNIWKPASADTHGLPVMVWIHGGAFILGAGSDPVYDGAALAKQGVIVVTFNYRLGALGFLAHPALSREQANGPLGNYGLLDQIKVLKWVQANIANFGGDPKNVTIVGESSGGISVTALMTSPLSRGLFAKAISQSGGGTEVFPHTTGGAASAETIGQVWAGALGLPKNATTAELRALPLDRLLKQPFFSYPNIDGHVLMQSPGAAFLHGEQARVPFLVGANSFEASLTVITDAFAEAAIGASQYKKFLSAYTDDAPSNAEARATLRGELFFVQPARFLARHQALINAPAYVYYFDEVPLSLRGKLQGAPHGGELPYLFATPAAALTKWDSQDRRVSKAMQGYWLRFIKSGNPNGNNAPHWDAVTPKSVPSLYLGKKIEMKKPTTLDNAVEAAAVKAASSLWAPQ